MKEEVESEDETLEDYDQETQGDYYLEYMGLEAEHPPSEDSLDRTIDLLRAKVKHRIYRKLEPLIDHHALLFRPLPPRPYLDLLEQVERELAEVRQELLLYFMCRPTEDERLLRTEQVQDQVLKSIERDPWLLKLLHTFLHQAPRNFPEAISQLKERFLKQAAEEKRRKKKRRRRRREGGEEEDGCEEEIYEPRLEQDWLRVLEEEVRRRLSQT